MTDATKPARRRVAFFMPYRYLPISTSTLNAARTWASRGYGVDIYVPPRGLFGSPDFGTQDIVVRAVRSRKVPRLPQLSYPYAATAEAWRGDYAYAVGFDQGGLIAAASLAVRRRCPLVYHSLELTLAENAKGIGDRLVHGIEVACARRIDIAITQDDERAALLGRELRLPRNRVMTVPNTPLGIFSGPRADYLRSKFGIEPSARIVLLSGSLIPEHLALEVIESVHAWPDGFVLAVHGWAPIPEYKAAILQAAARSPRRVFVSFDVLPVDLVDDLYSSADIGLGVYRPVDDNYEYIGAAAGKVFGYMRVGTPTIASDLPGMREIVVATGSGEVVRDVDEIPNRLLRIVNSFDDYSAAARSAFTQYEFSVHYERVVSALEAL